MRWKIELPEKPLSALKFCKKASSRFNTKQINQVRVRPGRRGMGVYGICEGCRDFGYRISCAVPGPFPFRVKLNKPFIKVQLEYETLNNIDEAFVWIFGHELFHFLRFTSQFKGVNDEINADKFGSRLLSEFRKLR